MWSSGLHKGIVALRESIEKEAKIIIDTLFPGPFHTRGGSVGPSQTGTEIKDSIDSSLVERANKYYNEESKLSCLTSTPNRFL